MKLSSHEEYGLRCLLQLGRRNNGEGMTIPELSQAESISEAYVGKIMRTLRQGGLVKSTRGQIGGYTLARPADRIYLDEVMAVLGGRFYDPEFCRNHAGQVTECAHTTDCSIRRLWSRVQEAVDSVLARSTLQDLLRPDPDTEYVSISLVQ